MGQSKAINFVKGRKRKKEGLREGRMGKERERGRNKERDREGEIDDRQIDR